MTRHRRQPGNRRNRGATRSPAPSRTIELRIERMGRGGDGLGMDGDEQIAVPFALPGEQIEASVSGRDATLLELHEAAEQRLTPICRHFGPPPIRIESSDNPPCGACALQHWQGDPYAEWKRGLLVAALARTGITAEVEPLVRCEPGTRRRLVLAARRTEAGVVLGFNALRSDRIVEMHECPVALPKIVSALPALRDLLASVMPRGGRARVSVLATETGLDVAVDNERDAPAPIVRTLLEPFARLAVDGEIAHERAAPVIRFGNIAVTPPPGAFVQAVESAEHAMASLVTDHLGSAKHVTDLYSGSGTFALRLGARSSVHAVEAVGEPLAALDRAARGVTGLRRITTERRDLDRRPLQPAELEGRDGPRSKAYDGLVFDPPRAGAEGQCHALARANVPLVAAVSCNPVTLARDLAILTGGGYRIDRIVPIDQFLFTPHLEAVALLSRD